MILIRAKEICELARRYVDRGINPSTAISIACKVLDFNEKMLENQLTY